MLKKFLTILLCAVLLTALVACGGGGAPEDTDTSAQTGTDSGNITEESSGDGTTELGGYDEDMEHVFLATDIRNQSIVIFDLALTNGNFNNLAKGDQCVVWEWKSADDPNCSGAVGSLDAAKLRYSEYYKKDVVIACASSGWAGVIDYEEKTILWEWRPGIGNFHSVEMMPNGDLVIAGSGDDGVIYYVPLSAGETKPSHTISSPHGHGVMYDPENEWLWILDYDEVYACIVSGYGTANAKLSRINGIAAKFENDQDGHVLSPVYGEPGKYWVTTSARVYQFDGEELALTKAATHYNDKLVKGIAYFSDGTMIQTIAKSGAATTDWSCGQIRIVTMEPSTGKVQKLLPKTVDVDFTDREFYKVHPVNKNYQ